MTRRTRSRVSGRTVGSSFTTRLTVMWATPAARATSTMVGGRLPCAILAPVLPWLDSRSDRPPEICGPGILSVEESMIAAHQHGELPGLVNLTRPAILATMVL